jgi:hypothetical protein
MLLIIFNLKALKKEKSSFGKVFHATEEDMMEFEVRLGEVRREFSETILELQKEIVELKKQNIYEVYENETKVKETSDEIISVEKAHSSVAPEYSSKQESEDLGTVNIKVDNNHERNAERNSVKIEEINKLLTKGLSVEEVSIKLGIGKGEVLLIKELYLR